MLQVMSGTRVFLACRPIDMRVGAPGLCAAVARVLDADPFSGSLFIFRSKRGNYLKMVYFDGTGICVFAKKMDRRRFVWPRTVATEAQVPLSAGQLSLLVEGIDWRNTVRPEPLARPVLV
jgi:transposase